MGRSEPGRLRLYLLECRLDAGLQGEGPARARDSLLGQLRLRRLCLSALRRGRLQQPGRGIAEGDILKSLQSPAACGQTGSSSIPRLIGLRPTACNSLSVAMPDAAPIYCEGDEWNCECL